MAVAPMDEIFDTDTVVPMYCQLHNVTVYSDGLQEEFSLLRALLVGWTHPVTDCYRSVATVEIF